MALSQQNVFDLLQERGYVDGISEEAGLRKVLARPPVVFYIGIDPSANSLHVGHMVPLMAMHYLQQAGHKPIVIIGGGTGRVGDPSGKTKMRQFLSPGKVARNARSVQQQVEKMGLLTFEGENGAVMVNNDEWLSGLSFMDFMTEIARHFSVNRMVRWTTFEKRLADEEFLSLMEFCYAVMQAYDFLFLHEEYGCTLQVGGRDQWTNILAGIDLIRAKTGNQAFALTFPLLETPDGQKMGKTEKGPLWLDVQRTPVFDFFQYWVNVPDEMVGQIFRLLTFLPLPEIKEIVAGDPKAAQERLALEVTAVVHGEEGARKAQEASRAAFTGEETSLEGMPTFTVPAEGMSLLEVLVESGALPSKSEVRRRADGGAIEIAGQRLSGRGEVDLAVRPGSIIKYGKTDFLRLIS